jgi:hypothetical protein
MGDKGYAGEVMYESRELPSMTKLHAQAVSPPLEIIVSDRGPE